MPRRTSYQTVQCQFFRWIVKLRGNTWYADGRGNTPSTGRHSLGTTDRSAAVERLRQLDVLKAVEFGLTDGSLLEQPPGATIELRHGWQRYCTYLARPEVARGTSAKTRQRYTAIFDKFVDFAERHHVQHWSQVTAQLVNKYLTDLQRREYADRTLYMEGTVIKQIMKWLVSERLIPRECLFRLPLRKVHGTRTYCWTKAEVAAMISHCRENAALEWLGNVIVALANTGMRISELAALRQQDIDLDKGFIRVSNDPPGAATTSAGRRRTKNRHDRAIPINPALRPVLEKTSRRVDGLVFQGPRGAKLKPDTVRNILIREVIEPLKQRFPTPVGEIGFEHGRLHSFRHFFCSTAVNDGMPQALLMQWLGHQDSAMVRHYYHLNDAESRQRMDRLNFTGDADNCVAVRQSTDDL